MYNDVKKAYYGGSTEVYKPYNKGVINLVNGVSAVPYKINRDVLSFMMEKGRELKIYERYDHEEFDEGVAFKHFFKI